MYFFYFFWAGSFIFTLFWIFFSVEIWRKLSLYTVFQNSAARLFISPHFSISRHRNRHPYRMVAMVLWIINEIWSASLIWGEIAVQVITAPAYRKADQDHGTVDKRWLFGSWMWSWAFLHLQEWGKLFSH